MRTNSHRWMNWGARTGRQVVGASEWITITQQHIDEFLPRHRRLPNWITSIQAGRPEPFGTTIAHGFLTLSLPQMGSLGDLARRRASGVNYGLNKVRFPAPVPGGATDCPFKLTGFDPSGRRADHPPGHDGYQRFRQAGVRGRIAIAPLRLENRHERFC